MSINTDENLIRNYRKGDEKSFEILIQKYLKPLYNFVYHYVGNYDDAQEVVQEVFTRVWKYSKKFNAEKSFKTWIYAIAKNAALDFLKKKKALPFSAFEDEKGENIIFNTLADPDPLPLEILERKDLARELSQAVQQLPLPYREVILLHYNGQFTFQEISQTLREPLNTI